MKKMQLLLLLLCTHFLVYAQANSSFPVKDMEVQWKSVAFNYNKTNKTLGAFVLHNLSSSATFPAAGWTIYFNTCRRILDTNTTAGTRISHYNGDIYTITPGKDFKSIVPGDSVTIDFLFDRVILNETDKPYGMYIVWNNDLNNGYTISNYAAGPLSLGIPGFVTPQKVFAINSVISDMAEDQLPPVFPSPNSYRYTKGECTIDKNVIIEADSSFRSEASYLKESLGKLWTNKKNKRSAASATWIAIHTTPMEKEGYELSVEPGFITIKAGDAAGAFYAVQSILSALPARAWKGNNTSIALPCFQVKDAPRFASRSLHIDVARNFKNKQTVFKIIDLMALYKMNVLHFHCTDDEGWRIQIPGLPELTDVGSVRGHVARGKNNMLPPSYGAGPLGGSNAGSGYYTREDFIEILKYATKHHILVMPEIESPGHARAAVISMKVRYEKYMLLGNKKAAEEYLLNDMHDESVYSSAQEWTDNVMCVALPSVYTFMEKVTDELIAMYKEAGAPLTTVHIGGDEVPAGVWERSPACLQLIQQEPSVKEINDLWLYYIGKMNAILQHKGLQLAAWEEAGMRKTKLDGNSTMIVNSGFASSNIQLHVWNNVTGWGSEDLPYRLANAGYKVMLSPVSNNYLDLAYYRNPEEPGYYWGGFQDIDKPFYFIPYDYYKTSKEDADGSPVNRNVFVGKDRLTDFGKSNIVGIEGLLWAENLTTIERMEYMLLPKILGVAERAWAKDPAWSTEKDSTRFEKMYNHDWSVFVNRIGKKELPKLDYINGGYQYRIPAPGAEQRAGSIYVNNQFPGMTIRYTTDGSEPTVKSILYKDAIQEKTIIRIKTFSSNGRSSRTVVIDNR